MAQINIRAGKPDDAQRIATIHVESWRHAYKGLIADDVLENLSVAEREKKWRKTLESPREKSRLFVAETDGKIIGFCIVGPSRDEGAGSEIGELGAIYIDSAHANQGAGSALMKEGLSFLRDQGFTSARLWVLTSNKAARTWYERKGWKTDGVTKIDDRGSFQLHETRYVIDL